jgi:putative membrane protein
MTDSVPDSPEPAGDDAGAPAERCLRGYLGIIARGFAMGAADVVPGVSGGTMALVLGIYEELINSVRTIIQPETLRLLARRELRQVFTVVPWKFLGCLGCGMVLAVLTLAKAIEHLLENQPSLLYAFFFGLVGASIVTVVGRLRQWSPSAVVVAVLSTVGAYVFVGLIPGSTPDTLPFLFGSGLLAACAMLLPGISGSFVLVLLGKYKFILAAVNDRDLLVIATVGIGVATGGVLFVHFIGWLLKRWHDPAMALLAGLMLGSLRKIWPWRADSDGIEFQLQPNIWPDTLDLPAIGLAVFGFVLVLVLSRIAGGAEAGSAAEPTPSADQTQ